MWYTYTAPSDGSITISTAGSRYDTLIYVFTGSAAEPTTVSCDDDQGVGLLQAVTTFNAIEGTQYQIVIYQTPTIQAYPPYAPTTLTGYPLSVDGTLYFSFEFSTILPTTVTKLVSSPDPSIFGQSVQFTATVSSKRPGTPTGTVAFSEGATTLGTSPLGGGAGQAGISGIPLMAGVNSITATYSGDSNFDASSASLNQTVNQARTSLAVRANQNPSALGLPVTFTAVIKPEYSGQATGTVTFKDGGATLGTTTVSGNSASLTTTALTFGTNSITAIYGGDSNFGASTSPALSHVVKYASTTALTSSSNPSTFGNPVTFTVEVTSTAGTPVGTVEILNGTMVLTTGLKLKSGSAEYTTSQLLGGPNIITAVYSNPSGALDIVGSTSAPITEVVLIPGITVLHAFVPGVDGESPQAGLLRDAQGNLYGTTSIGGAYGIGAVYKLDNLGNETVIHSCGTSGDGGCPYAVLIQDAQGNLYGTTEKGGNSACMAGTECGGTVFKVTAAGQETVLYSFTGTAGDGGQPYAGVIQDEQGILLWHYLRWRRSSMRLWREGCGTVFKATAAGQENVLYSFTGTGGDGANPQAG